MFFKSKKKSSTPSSRDQKAPSAAEPSFIGRNCVFEGHITCDGELHIDGTVRGTVQASLCVVDTAGVIQGTLSGHVVHVRGRVLGPIQASNVLIYAGAHVEGDVFNDTISIENGAYVYGSIRHNTSPAGVSSNTSAPLTGDLLSPKTNMTSSELRVVSTRK